MPSRHDEGPHNVMKHLKAARPARPKRRPGVAKMVLVPHDKVGAGFMRNVVFPVIAFLGVGSAGYFAIELSQHRQQQNRTAQTQDAVLQAAQRDLAQLQRRTDTRKAQFKAAIDDLERRLAQSQTAVGTLTATVQATPQPVGEAVVRPGGINIMALKVSDPSPGQAGRVHHVELTIRRESKLRTPEPLARSQAALVNLTWESAPSMQGKLRLVALPENERDGKRVYLPGKAWRRRNGFDIDLAPGAEQTIAGDLVLPARFEPAYIRVEVFVDDHEDGGSIMLRRVYPWSEL